MNTKVIYSPSMARQLLQKGNIIIDIKPNKQNKRETIFVFECTDKLLEEFDNFKILHDKEISRILNSDNKTISSMGI